MGEAVRAVVAESAVAARPPAEQPVQRGGVQVAQLGAHRVVDFQLHSLGVDGLLQAGGGFARRRGERDVRWRLARGGRLLGEQRDDPRDGRRLAGAGPAGDDREAPQHGSCGGKPLPRVGVPGEQAREPACEHVDVERRRRPVAERPQVGGHLAFLAPVAIEIQRAADEAQRAPGVRLCVLADCDERAARERPHPFLGLGPRQRRQVDRLLGVDRRRGSDRGEVDEHVAEPRAADGERGAERDPVVLLAGERAQTHRDVDVGGRQHADVVERAQQPRGAARAPRVVHVDLDQRRSDHRACPQSNRSLSAATSAPGGRHANTPHGSPSTTGVSGPIIPRRKRYSTPAT